MKRLLILLFAATLLSACGDDKSIDRTTLTLSQTSVLLGDLKGAQTTFTIQAEGPWTIATKGDSFAVSPVSGRHGLTTVTVTRTADKASRTQTLGTLFVRSAASPASRSVTIKQSVEETVSQTVLMYLPWAGSLYEALQKNVADAKIAVSKGALGRGRLLVFMQSSPTDATLREIYYNDGNVAETVLKTYTNLNVTQAATIQSIMNDVVLSAPAEKYAMVIGSHGMAWIPYYYSTSRGMIRGITLPMEKPHWEYVSPDGMFTRWFGDGDSRNTNTTTLAEALTAAGLKMEFILFDDCFMSSIEVAYDLRNVTKYLICSPCEVMSYGYPYDLVIPQMFTESGTNYSLSGICHAFYDFYTTYEAPNYNCGAIAVTVSSEVERMASIMQRINAANPQYVADAAKPLQRYEYLYSPTRFYDYSDYVHALCMDSSLLAEFDAQMERLVPSQYRLHTDYFYSNGKRLITSYSGISTSDPSTSTTVTTYRSNTDWWKATH